MTSRPFQGYSGVQEMRCSGEMLTSDVDVLSLALYRVPDNKVIASSNHRNRKCRTSENFVSCEINDVDSRQSRLTILVTDLAPGHSRAYVCNATTVEASGETKVISWRIHARHLSKSTSASPPGDGSPSRQSSASSVCLSVYLKPSPTHFTCV